MGCPRRRRAWQLGRWLLLSLTVGITAVQAQTHQALLSPPAGDWLYHNRDYAGTRYSPLSEINRENVAGLRPVCLHQLGALSDFQTGPVVHDGVLYLTSGASTLAVGGDDCRLRWRHDWQPRQPLKTVANRGVALADGQVFRGTADGYLLALDAVSGDELWARQVADPALGEHFTMAPLVYDDLVVIGPAGSNNGVSGWVAAFDRSEGHEVWRFHTVPGALAPVAPLGVRIGGGSLWTPMSLDVKDETLFVAVSAPAPNVTAMLGVEGSLYTNSVLALDVRSGELRWYRQLLSADEHGWDITQVSPLFELVDAAGNLQSSMAVVGKDGLLRSLDRRSGESQFSTAVTTRRNSSERVTVAGTYVCPGVLGGVLWNGPAWSPETGLLVTPAVDLCATFYRATEVRYSEGREYFDGTALSDPASLRGWITAVDARTGETAWQYESPLPVVAAVTTTAGGLVLGGELSGDFLVLDAETGKEHYRFFTGGAIGAGIISYEVEGRQYIAVASGHPSAYQVNGDMGAPTLLVFALPSD